MQKMRDQKEKAGDFCVDFVKGNIRSGNEMSFPVATDSMLPLIKATDRVVVNTCGASDVKLGDIVLFERDSSLIVHRVLERKIEDKKIILVPKADRVCEKEKPFSEEQFLGKVVKIHKESFTLHLERWHGIAINRSFYFYSLLKMRTFALLSGFKERSQRQLRKEDILIRLCSVTTINEAAREDIRKILNQDVDWNYFMRRVQGEDTASLIYKVFSRINSSESLVPLHVMNHLKDFYYAVMAQNISLTQSIEKIFAAFQKENITALVFKGFMLAGSIYKDIGLRPMGDVDILLRREEVSKADGLLRRNGFYPEFELKDIGNLSSGQYRNSIVYRTEDSVPVAVHIHWHIVNFTPFHNNVLRNINMDNVWNESVPFQIGLLEMRTFSLHHQIIYLSMHALNHSFHPLIRLSDIHELLCAEKDQIDWERLVKEADAFNLSKCVYYVFYLLSRIFHTDIPAFILHRLKPRKIGLIERTFLSSVLSGNPILTGEWLICYGMNDSFRDKVTFLWTLLFPPQKELAIIRKRDDGRAGMSDYMKRLTAGLGCALKVMFNFTRQASFKL